MDRNIEEVEFTIFDTETTGLDPELGDRIVEIAAVRFRGQEKLGQFQTLVNPQRPISPAAFEVNQITADMLKGAPTIEEVLPKFLDFIQGSCLCSYNASFDLGFLNNELKTMGRSLNKETMVADILTMAKRLLPGLERYALWFVAEKLGIKDKQEHRALSDVTITLEVFNRLKENFKGKGISDLRNFLSLFGLTSFLWQDINNQKIAKIQEAIDQGYKLKIKYMSTSQSAISEREVIPKEIKQDKKHSYLIGYCCLRNEERTFRIDSILSLDTV